MKINPAAVNIKLSSSKTCLETDQAQTCTVYVRCNKEMLKASHDLHCIHGFETQCGY